MKLYKHQMTGIDFLRSHPAALLADEMGTGKTRQALVAAFGLHEEGAVTQLLVFCPAAVRYSWGEELGKLLTEGYRLSVVSYLPDGRRVTTGKLGEFLTVLVVSYGLLAYGWGPKGEPGPHVEALEAWARNGKTLLVCDESSFIKNHQAATTMGALRIRNQCRSCWLLNGTPVANSPLDLWAQGLVMGGRGPGPLAGFKNFYQFRASFGFMGGYKMKKWIPDKAKLESLRERFRPYALRRLKEDCLDLPPKIYEVREIALQPETWKLYLELKRDFLVHLPPAGDVQLEPHAHVRRMRLCQLTSGHIGTGYLPEGTVEPGEFKGLARSQDISREKLQFITEMIMLGELSGEGHLIIWCRWRRERERLAKMLEGHVSVMQVHGDQSEGQRREALDIFTMTNEPVHGPRKVLLGQPHAGGFGLNLTQAKVAVYLSNDDSYLTRVQSEDRCHRIGQVHKVTYLDLLATGPNHERTMDHVLLKALKDKDDVARWTSARWRKELT